MTLAQPTLPNEGGISAPMVPEHRLRPDRGSKPLRLHFSGLNRSGIAYCAGQHVEFNGDKSRIVLRGGCRSLTIRGNNNDVTVEIQAGGSIEVRGRGNTVHWHLSTGTQQPMLRDFGRNNIFKTQT